jgi:hypothetical protein
MRYYPYSCVLHLLWEIKCVIASGVIATLLDSVLNARLGIDTPVVISDTYIGLLKISYTRCDIPWFVEQIGFNIRDVSIIPGTGAAIFGASCSSAMQR